MRHIQRPANPRASTRHDGFTLIELSIFLLIVAVLAGSALMFGTGQQGFARQKQTYDKMRVLEEALAAYTRLNGHLPCPANGTLGRLDVNLGNEERDTATGQCNNVTRIAIGGASDPDMFVGSLPTDALNISEEFMFDGWDRRFIYAVDERFTSRVTFFGTQEDDPGLVADSFQRNFIVIVDGLNAANIRSRYAVYVLMSAGENGIGAWPREGGARLTGAPTDTTELNNYTLTDKQFAITLRSTTYDDIVHFRKKDLLLAEAGVVLGGRTRRSDATLNLMDDCTLARHTLLPINFPNTNLACSSSTPPAGCRPLEGPVGCENEFAVNAINPAYIDFYDTTLPDSSTVRHYYTRPQLEPIYSSLPRHGECINRQIRLAEPLYARCLYF